MKKLYKKGTVHPTPPFISDQLSSLPASILTLTLALSPDDRVVLAYLLSCSSNNYSNIKNKNSSGEHAASFNCSCFRCYMSFWVRWDASPKRQLIHEIIDAFEDGLMNQVKKEKGKRERRRKGGRNDGDGGVVGSSVKSELSLVQDEFGESDSVESSIGGGEGEEEKGSIRRLVSFVGEKIWGFGTSFSYV